MKTILKITGPKATIRVTSKNEFGEHVVRTAGLRGADYFTDDRDDAMGSAAHLAGFIENDPLITPRSGHDCIDILAIRFGISRSAAMKRLNEVQEELMEYVSPDDLNDLEILKATIVCFRDGPTALGAVIFGGLK